RRGVAKAFAAVRTCMLGNELRRPGDAPRAERGWNHLVMVTCECGGGTSPSEERTALRCGISAKQKVRILLATASPVISLNPGTPLSRQLEEERDSTSAIGILPEAIIPRGANREPARDPARHRYRTGGLARRGRAAPAHRRWGP